MTVPNLYWPIFKNLETECLLLANYIHFTDDQLEVYSLKIADLLIRCAIEIEAITKDLYQNLGGNMSPTDNITGDPRTLYFDTDCLELIEQHWRLSKKQIKITAINSYFTDSKNQVITPLNKANKRGTSGSKWKQAYQAIKHDRKNSLADANIQNLLHALGALFILNLYYKEDSIDIGRVYLHDTNFDCRANSDIFSTFTFNATSLSMAESMDDSCIIGYSESELDKSIFIIKYNDKSFSDMHQNMLKDSEITLQNFRNSKVIQTYIERNPEVKFRSISEACLKIGGADLLNRIICMEHSQQVKTHRMEAKLNRNCNIYPNQNKQVTPNNSFELDKH